MTRECVPWLRDVYETEYFPAPEYTTEVLNPDVAMLLSIFDPLAVNASSLDGRLPKESKTEIVNVAGEPTVATVNAEPVKLDRVRHTGPGTTRKVGRGG